MPFFVLGARLVRGGGAGHLGQAVPATSGSRTTLAPQNQPTIMVTYVPGGTLKGCTVTVFCRGGLLRGTEVDEHGARLPDA